MGFKKIEFNNVNSFLSEEIPKSIGMTYAPLKIKNCFNIKQQFNGKYNIKQKKQKER